MILAVDHVACCGPDAQALADGFIREGYVPEVTERGLANLDIKAPFLSCHAPDHDLTLLRRPASVSVEVLDHRCVGSGTGYLERTGPTSFACRTSDLASSEVFWGVLGFRRDAGGAWVFRSAFSAPLELTLHEEEMSGVPMLDDRGFNAVAVLSSAADAERERLSEVADVTELRRLAVGGRTLELFFARNRLGGELVEVIGLAKTGTVK